MSANPGLTKYYVGLRCTLYAAIGVEVPPAPLQMKRFQRIYTRVY
uniref:Uncharacterized protein n=1 Tax=Rhizophora mucronata TaxID=61149 RepID=A0A2P2NUZ6_RHIMU